LEGDKPWLLKCRLLNISTHGTWIICHLSRRQLIMDGCTPLKLGQMVRLVTKSYHWPKAILKYMVYFTVILFFLQPKWLLYFSSLLWQLFTIGLFISWILRFFLPWRCGGGHLHGCFVAQWEFGWFVSWSGTSMGLYNLNMFGLKSLVIFVKFLG